MLTPLVNINQHGFIKDYQRPLINWFFKNVFLDAFPFGFQVDVNFTDFPKAFDKVNNSILISKLYDIGMNFVIHIRKHIVSIIILILFLSTCYPEYLP